MSRKSNLQERALAYSAANHERGADSLSWEDGYRAAMRDMRKEVSRNITVMSPIGRCYVKTGRISQFLRPLR